VPAKIILRLLSNPEKFKLAAELAALLGIHTETKSEIIAAIWRYIKANQLQDVENRTLINNDEAFQRIFGVPQMPISTIAESLLRLIFPPDPIVFSFTVEYVQSVCFSCHEKTTTNNSPFIIRY